MSKNQQKPTEEKQEVDTEALKKDMSLIFSYARTHIVNTQPHDEELLKSVISLKSILFTVLDKK